MGGFYSGDFPRRGASHSRPTAHRMRSRPPNAPWVVDGRVSGPCPNAARPALEGLEGNLGSKEKC